MSKETNTCNKRSKRSMNMERNLNRDMYLSSQRADVELLSRNNIGRFLRSLFKVAFHIYRSLRRSLVISIGLF